MLLNHLPDCLKRAVRSLDQCGAKSVTQAMATAMPMLLDARIRESRAAAAMPCCPQLMLPILLRRRVWHATDAGSASPGRAPC